MSRGKVEVARRGYEAFNRGDMEAVYASLDAEVVWEEWSTAPDAETYFGHDGVREFFDKLSESFDQLRFDPQEFIDAGDQIVVPTIVRARGRTSGTEVTLPTVHLWTYRDGKGVRVRVFGSKAEALEPPGCQSRHGSADGFAHTFRAHHAALALQCS